jgi:hypothetical protein
VVAQEGLEELAVAQPRLGAAERAEPQADLLDPQLVEQRGEQRDGLGVDRRVVGADRLGAHLPELPEAAGLRALLAEEARQVPELHRLRQLVHAVLHVGARDRRGALGAQRDRAPTAVVEGVHLLLHDVGGLADAPREELRGFERRRLDAPVPGALEHALGGIRHALAPGLLLGQDVERAPRRLQDCASSAGRGSSGARGRAW